MSGQGEGHPEAPVAISPMTDDPRAFFDQLTPISAEESLQITPQQPVSDSVAPGPVAATQSLQSPSPTSLVVESQTTTDAVVIENIIANASEVVQPQSYLPPSMDQSAPIIANVPSIPQPGIPQSYPSSHLPQNLHNEPPTQFNIPLTPQCNPSTKESCFATPEPQKNTVPQQYSVPTHLTPVQSAMMMSMTTSMLGTTATTSPSASMDVNTTTIKFQQASIVEKSEPEPSTAVPTLASVAEKSSVAVPSLPTQQKITPPPRTTKSPSEITTVTDKSKPNEAKLFKYFGSTKMSSPFESIGGKMSGGGNDSAMINPVYMSPTDNFNISNAIPSPDSFLTPATEQDVFTASLLSSDADRRHDAWIPSEVTKQALMTMSSSPPGTYFPEKELLTMPGIAVKEDFGDPVKNLVRTYLGEDQASKRVVMTASSVTQDDRGLRQLIFSGCYHAAVNLTTQLLTVYGQGEGRAGHPSKHTAHSIQLWFTRIALLVKLRRFSLAEVECQYFGDLDAPDLYFEFYPELYGGRKGSMVPFGFRLVVAELPQHLGKHTQSLDRLNALLNTCDQIIRNVSSGLSEDGSPLEMTTNMREDSLKLWRTRRLRVIYSLTNCSISLKDFRLAGSLLERLIQEDPNSAAGLNSALGRLCLQLGDVAAAQEAFNQYLEHTPPPPHHDPVQGLLHSAYISIAQNAFKDASEILQQAHKINSNNGLVINNLGVCLMYTGRVREAITLVEGAVFSQPERFLHEALVLNLATMYELESSNAYQKKLKLLSLIAHHKGDSFNVAALKLQPQ